jgi:ribonuclease R
MPDLSRGAVLARFHARAGRTFSARELSQIFELGPAERRSLARILRQLCDEGLLARRGGRYALADERPSIEGVLSFRANATAEITTDSGESYTVLARHLAGALAGDRVRAELLPAREGVRRAAAVREVVANGPGQVLGVYRRAARGGFLEPREPELFPYYLTIARADDDDAQDGDLVIAELHAPPSPGATRVAGRIVDVLGRPSEPDVEIAAIAYRHGLALDFPADVLDEVEAIPTEVRADDRAGRTDMRDVPFVTIDGADARDFDDAIAVAPRPQGGFELRVAVADVSHYVRERTALDGEALRRGTSVYFPGRVLPMLPHPLSNGICSLKPDVDRLAMVVTLAVDSAGRVGETRFYEAVIRSHARLTYDEVWHAIESRRTVRGVGDPGPLVRLCEVLMAQRRARGSLDFDIAEARIVLDDDGEIVDVVRRSRNLAHRIVEECMLAANEAVARDFGIRDAPTVYRVHDEPDEEKLVVFARLASALGFHLRPGEANDPRALARFVDGLGDRPGARALHALLLRSMKQAVYQVDNIGHFGLAAEEYLHFTSPIRRYPDLLVHRLLRAHLQDRGTARSAKTSKARRGRATHDADPEAARESEVERLAQMASRSSARERTALEAEREVIAYYRARLMEPRVGEELDGQISGVAPFGVFVELERPFVDGLVHVQSLGDDFYEFFEDSQRLVGRETGRALALGDRVRVRVDEVSVARRQVSLSFAQGASPARTPRIGQGSRRRKR